MKITAIFLLVTLFCSHNNSRSEASKSSHNLVRKNKTTDVSAVEKKYDIKSGIIAFETSVEMSGMNIKTKKVLYFDDFGIKECEEEYKVDQATGKETLKKRTFVKDGYRYTCSVENKGGMKTKALGYGVAAKFDMTEAATLKENQFKKIAGEVICGKSCEGFSMVTPSGDVKMYGWNRIVLKSTVDNASMSMKTATIATKVEENAAIPADKFEVPKDVKMVDK